MLFFQINVVTSCSLELGGQVSNISSASCLLMVSTLPSGLALALKIAKTAQTTAYQQKGRHEASQKSEKSQTILKYLLRFLLNSVLFHIFQRNIIQKIFSTFFYVFLQPINSNAKLNPQNIKRLSPCNCIAHIPI